MTITRNSYYQFFFVCASIIMSKKLVGKKHQPNKQQNVNLAPPMESTGTEEISLASGTSEKKPVTLDDLFRHSTVLYMDTKESDGSVTLTVPDNQSIALTMRSNRFLEALCSPIGRNFTFAVNKKNHRNEIQLNIKEKSDCNIA